MKKLLICFASIVSLQSIAEARNCYQFLSHGAFSGTKHNIKEEAEGFMLPGISTTLAVTTLPTVTSDLSELSSGNNGGEGLSDDEFKKVMNLLEDIERGGGIYLNQYANEIGKSPKEAGNFLYKKKRTGAICTNDRLYNWEELVFLGKTSN